MYEIEFRTWLETYKGYNSQTIDSRISNCRTIQASYGDLNSIKGYDDLLQEFTYTKDDFINNRPAKHKIVINGNIYNGTATYRSALNLYAQFIEAYNQCAHRNVVMHIEDSDYYSKEGTQLAKKIIDILSSFKYNSDIHKITDKLVTDVTEYLENDTSLQEFTWEIEYKPSKEYNDRIDLYGISTQTHNIIIEFDAPRADQVAKKFISRAALFKNSKTIHIAICYPSDAKINRNECEKYFKYCSQLASLISNQNSETIFGGVMY